MRILIAYSSVHHKNTEKVAKAMAEASGAELLNLAKDGGEPVNPADYDLIGVGSGIYAGKVHKSMRKFLGALPKADGTKAFVFSTSSFEKPNYNGQMEKALTEKGYELFNGFSCKGWNTFPLVRLKKREGLDKGHPDGADLEAAKEYIAAVTAKME